MRLKGSSSISTFKVCSAFFLVAALPRSLRPLFPFVELVLVAAAEEEMEHDQI